MREDEWPHGADIAVTLLGLLATGLALGYAGVAVGFALAIWGGR